MPVFEQQAQSWSARRHTHHASLQRLQTSLVPAYEVHGLSASPGTSSAFSDTDYFSPLETSQSSADTSYSEHYSPYHPLFSKSFLDGAAPLMFHDDFGYTEHIPRHYSDDMSSTISSEQGRQDYIYPTPAHAGSVSGATFSEMLFEDECVARPANTQEYDFSAFGPQVEETVVASEEEQKAVIQSSMSISFPQTLFSSRFYPLSPRMQQLLDYYDKSICPVLVAFDGPANPYRMHVIHLAMQNEGLQSAIAALSTNNIRMRGLKEVRQIGYIQDRLDNNTVSSGSGFSLLAAQESRDMHGAPTPEELCYKTNSIELLNTQLADPSLAQDDSVLATLLILCLFHVCDSGFSKFKTQLAGVQKLLSMRGPSIQSGFSGWVEMFFTWFDVMTSTVNDRETLIQGESLDMLDLSANLGALEQFSGCDGRLFKLIARLGRLNLLSQNRPVRVQECTDETPRASPQPKHKRVKRDSKKQTQVEFYSLDYDRLDGNGWGAPLDLPSPRSDDGPMTDGDEDARHEFWAEWNDIRSRLQEWELDPSQIPSAPTSPTFGDAASQLCPEQRDLLHISESFRYSALLYTERLAYPTLPSSSLNLQTLVSQALFHITQLAVDSCVNKFLLWPLFITGTECVDETHRAIVRQRCVEIQKESGFFNNLSGLEVLERVWREDDGEAEEVLGRRRDSGAQGQAFRWRRAMDRVDGEYIVI
ncbi:hypothetical protein LTR04_007306 [Oleoguttula sp. CCFEE 6159]|nr:hypothetical protein LTR04_007306 [Oleoguttula sp. CCFEE 6159]